MAQDFISALFGAPPDYSNAFTPQQTQQMQSNALAQGGIGALIALLGASGQTARPISTQQALAGALGAGLGGYQTSFDNTLKQMLTAQQLGEYKQKQDARKRYEQAIAAATTQRPQTIPMATGEGSQLRMLQEQTADFGTEGANITAGALMSNPNLPMVDVVDPAAANRAAMDYVRRQSPEKFLELTAKEGKETFAIMTPEQKRAFGLPADRSFQIGSSGKIDEISKGPLSTTIVSPGDNALAKADAEQIAALSNRVNSARVAANTADSIYVLLKGKGEGDIVKVGADLAQRLGIKSETASANALAQALQVSAATQVRAAGSGSTSDLEFKSFLSVFPSLSNSEEGRKLMAEGLKAFAARDAAIEREARRLFENKTYSAAALADYDANLGPVLDPKKFGNLSQSGAPSSAPSTQRRSY